MTAVWVPYWDDSFQQATDLAEMYRRGFRVMAGYVAGGSAGKWTSAARIQAWKNYGDDTGFFPLFEGSGTEPLNSPSLGDNHAKAARAGARARGVPDSVSISPAMDTNVSTSDAIGPIATYCRLWIGADTAKPVMYVESDAGAVLYSHGLTAGTFSPAAYGWDNPARLLTPANAPSHVMATQEHNGVALAGGDVDTGHIRQDAPCIWWLHSSAGVPSAPIAGDYMPLTQEDADMVAQAVVSKVLGSSGPTVGVALQNGISDDAVSKLLAKTLGSSGPNVGVALQSTYATVQAIQKQIAAEPLPPAPADIAAAVVAALPQASGLTVADVIKAVETALGSVHVEVTAGP